MQWEWTKGAAAWAAPFSFVMVQYVPYPLFFAFGHFPFVVPVVVLSVVGGIVGVVDIPVPFIAPVVIPVAVIQLIPGKHGIVLLYKKKNLL